MLSGPLPLDPGEAPSTSKVRVRDPKTGGASSKSSAANAKSSKHNSNKDISSSKNKQQTQRKPIMSSTMSNQDPVYIRIKLKPDHMYDEKGCLTSQSSNTINAIEVQKPASLNLTDSNKKPAQSFAQIIQKEDSNRIEPATIQARATVEAPQGRSISSTPSASPKLSKQNFLRDTNLSSKSPSPSLSRKSSFCSLFKSKDGILSPDSPTGNYNYRNTPFSTIHGLRKNAMLSYIKYLNAFLDLENIYQYFF